MSFSIFVDGSSNLPGEILRKLDISILPCSYSMNGVPSTYDGCLDTFDSHEYYEMLRQGGKVQTSLLNTQLFLDSFRPVLERGGMWCISPCPPASAEPIRRQRLPLRN